MATHIEVVESGNQIQIHLINVEDAEAAFSFQIVVNEDSQTAYAEGVAKLLFSLATGRIGQKEDIRDVPDTVSEEEAALRFTSKPMKTYRLWHRIGWCVDLEPT